MRLHLQEPEKLKEEPALVATQGSPSQIGASLVNMSNSSVESDSHEEARHSVKVIGWCLVTGGFLTGRAELLVLSTLRHPHLVTASDGVMLLEQGSILPTNPKSRA